MLTTVGEELALLVTALDRLQRREPLSFYCEPEGEADAPANGDTVTPAKPGYALVG